MRSKLQYLYSIFILTGVLASAYWMVDKHPVNTRETRVQSSFTYRAEPSLSAPGLEELLRFETQFKAIQDRSPTKSERQLNESKKKKPHKLPGLKE